MPSDASVFSQVTRRFRPLFFINLDGTGFVEYTKNIEHFSILESNDLQPFGIFDTKLNVSLKINNPSLAWSRPGKQVKLVLQGSSDNWATSYESQIFFGLTERSSTVPDFSVALVAQNLNTKYLDQDAVNGVYTNQDAHTILRLILSAAGIAAELINLSPAGITIQAYVVAPGTNVREHVLNIAAATMKIYGFDASGVFMARSLVEEFATATNTYIHQIIQQKTRKLYQGYYNRIIVKGREIVYLRDNDVAYIATGFQGVSISPGRTLFVKIPLPNLQMQYAQTTNPFGTGEDSSVFRLLDDDASGLVVNIYPQSRFVSSESNGTQSLNVQYVNTGGQVGFLRSAKIYGNGIRILGEIKKDYKNAAAILEDGKEYSIVVDSLAIQSSAVAGRVLGMLQRHFTTPSAMYALEVRARHNEVLGLPIQITTRAGQVVNGYAMENDRDAGVGETGYNNGLVMKKAPTPLTFLIVDDNSVTPTLTNQAYCGY
jgi:hypothetical protein